MSEASITLIKKLTPPAYAGGFCCGDMRTIYRCVRSVCCSFDIPLFEEISYYGGWWRYVPTRYMFGHTPAYVALFEGLVVAALPLLLDRLERRSWLETGLLGVVIGIWMAISALTAWLLLGR